MGLCANDNGKGNPPLPLLFPKKRIKPLKQNYGVNAE